MKPILSTDPRIKAMAERCSKVRGGIIAKDIIVQSGLSRCLVQKLLAQCRMQGLLVVYKPPGEGWYWMSPENYAAILVQVNSDRLLRKRENGRKRYHDKRKIGLIDSYNRITEPPEWQIERKYTKAGDVPPPKTQAVNSVWQWGQR